MPGLMDDRFREWKGDQEPVVGCPGHTALLAAFAERLAPEPDDTAWSFGVQKDGNRSAFHLGRDVSRGSAATQRPHRRRSVFRVRREKAVLFQWVRGPPGDRSSRKQPGQTWK
jgi:hypothetical protein